MNETQHYPTKFRISAHKVPVESGRFKAKIEPTEYIHYPVRVLETNSITSENVNINQSQKLDLNF